MPNPRDRKVQDYGQRDCDNCGGSYQAKAATAKYCKRMDCIRERNRQSTRKAKVEALQAGDKLQAVDGQFTVPTSGVWLVSNE